MLDFSKYFKNKEQRNEFYLALFVILLFGAFLSYLIPSLDLVNPTKVVTEQVTSTQEIDLNSTQLEVDNSSTLNTWVDKLEEDKVKNTNHRFTSHTDTTQIKRVESDIVIDAKPAAILDPSDIIEKVDTVTNVVDQKITEVVTDIQQGRVVEEADIKAETKIVEEKIVETIVEKKEAIVEKTKIEEVKPTPKPKVKKKPRPVEKSPSSCVVILGAFSDKDNLNSLKSKVLEDIDEKYIYQGRRKSFDVIGIYVDCNNNEAKLAEYQEKYAKKAWLLKIK